MITAAKPIKNGRFLQTGWFVGQHGIVGGVGPVGEIIDKVVFLRIAVDVGDEGGEIAVRGDGFAAKWVFKGASGTAVRFIDRLGIRIAQIAKGLARSGNLLFLPDSKGFLVTRLENACLAKPLGSFIILPHATHPTPP